MEKLLKLRLVGLIAIFIGFSNFTFADINITGYGNDSIKSPVFEQANSPSGNMLSFDYDQTGDQSSLGTCAMNPMGSNSTEAILEEFPITDPETYTPISTRADTLLSSSAESTTPYTPNDRYTPLPPEPAPPSATPEPATLLVLGVGMIGLTPLVRRYRRK